MTRINALEEFGLSILNVPQELKEGQLWAVSSMAVLDPNTGRRDKSPRNPHTGERISVTDRSSWVTFDEAVNSGYPAVGMLLTSDDPYVLIDLDKAKDDEQNEFAKRVYRAFKSYTETSFSGNGAHIIVKGPNEVGRRKNNIEIYSQDRYVIFTGRVVKQLPIEDGGETLRNLRSRLQETDNPDTLPIVHDEQERESDSQILKRMFDAKNGDSVRDLYETVPSANDDWSLLDAKLAQHICFYTKNKEQALRLFRGSALYRGRPNGIRKNGYERVERYEEDYLLRRTFARAWYLNKLREDEAKLADTEFMKLVDSKKEKQEKSYEDLTPQELARLSADKPVEIKRYESKLPPIKKTHGLVNDIAEFIYSAAPRPVWEIAVAGAMTMISGIAGRHYNINGSGLGLFNIILAGTGRGKEAAPLGINHLFEAVAKNTPSVNMFRGPSHIASGQGLIRSMGDTDTYENIPSKMLLLSEFGHTMNIITSKDATSADLRTRQALLDFFSKNSWGSAIKESAYADKQNNTKEILSPNLTLLGDTTQDMFFKSISMNIIREGFLPRFLLFEYDGPRVKSNYNMNLYPKDDLVARITALVHQVISLRDTDQCINIVITPEAQELLSKFDDFCDDMINDNDDSAEMWNRAHLIALRVAGCVAVGNNIFEPKVTFEDAKWAIDLVTRSVYTIKSRIESGAFGTGDVYMENLVRETVYDYYDNARYEESSSESIKKFSAIPYSYIKFKLEKEPAFAQHKSGPSFAITKCLHTLTQSGDLLELNSQELRETKARQIRRSELVYMKGEFYDSNRNEYYNASPVFGGE